MFKVLGIIWLCMMAVSLLFVREIYDLEEVSSPRKSTYRATRYMSIVIEANQNALMSAVEDNYIEEKQVGLLEDAIPMEDMLAFPKISRLSSIGEAIVDCPSIKDGLKSSQFKILLYIMTVGICKLKTSD
jgi:hypothetical protein